MLKSRRSPQSEENAARLPGISFPHGIYATDDLAVIGRVDVLLLAVPSQATDDAASRLAPYLIADAPVVACAKGLERATGRLQSDVIAARLSRARVAALSGPGFADEIARGLPTAVTIAAGDLAFASSLAERLSSSSFRAYATDDLMGVELGGALKNVLAIACGIVVGRRLGESARAALIARGLAEMKRLGTALGARPATFMGLSGLGDLVLTATSAKSRNLAFGIKLGEGASALELMGAGQPLAEGAFTAEGGGRARPSERNRDAAHGSGCRDPGRPH